MNKIVIFASLIVAAAAHHGYSYDVKVHHEHHPVAHHAPLFVAAHGHEEYHAAPAYHGDDHKDYYHHPAYKFEYGVNDPHTHDHKSQWEHRDGDKVTGEYSLDEADGTKRVVSYHADGKTGFHAEVKKVGYAHHGHHY